jgi:hypothetical protein
VVIYKPTKRLKIKHTEKNTPYFHITCDNPKLRSYIKSILRLNSLSFNQVLKLHDGGKLDPYKIICFDHHDLKPNSPCNISVSRVIHMYVDPEYKNQIKPFQDSVLIYRYSFMLTETGPIYTKYFNSLDYLHYWYLVKNSRDVVKLYDILRSTYLGSRYG